MKVQLGKYYLEDNIISFPVMIIDNEVLNIYSNVKGDSVGSENVIIDDWWNDSSIINYDEFKKYNLEERFIKYIFSEWYK